MTNINLPEYPKISSQISVIRPKIQENSEYVLTNLQSGKHLRLSREAYRIASKLDGRHKLEDLVNTDNNLDESTIMNIVALLAAHGLIENYKQEASSQKPTTLNAIETKSMSSRHPLLDAKILLVKIDPYINWVFTSAGFIIWCTLLGSAGLIILSTPEKSDSIFSWLTQMSILDGAAFTILIFFSKFVHEMGHASALQRFANLEGIDPGPITVGVTRFFFFLLPYTDASASWQISSPKKRAIIAFSGVYFELFLAALAILIAASISNEVARAMLHQFAFIAGVSTLLFNLNPFIKLDGYHILSDILQTQNLQPRSMAEMGKLSRKLLFKNQDNNKAHMVYVLYSIGSFLFRCIVLTGITIAAYFLYPPLAIFTACIAISAVIVRPFVKFLIQNKEQSFSRTGVLVLILLIIAPVLPVQNNIIVSGIIENQTLQDVILPTGTIVKSDDDKSNPHFDNPELDQNIQVAQLNLAITRLNYQTAIAERDSHAIKFKESILAAQDRLKRLEYDRTRLTITDPENTLTFEPGLKFLNKQHIPANTPVGVFLDPDHVRLKLFVPETKIDLLSEPEASYPVKYWLDNETRPHRTSINSANWNFVQNLPSAGLTRTHEGKISVDPTIPAQLIPAHPHFSTFISLGSTPTKKAVLIHGQTVTAVVSTGWTFLAKAMWNNFTTKINSQIEELQKL